MPAEAEQVAGGQARQAETGTESDGKSIEGQSKGQGKKSQEIHGSADWRVVFPRWFDSGCIGWRTGFNIARLVPGGPEPNLLEVCRIMSNLRLLPFLLLLVTPLLLSQPVTAFMGDGCGAGECKDCHSIEMKEAEDIFQDNVDKIHSVKFAEVPGMFQVDVEKEGKKFPLYLDFSKQYIFAGNIYKIKDRSKQPPTLAKLTKEQLASIPLDDALRIGSTMAEHQVIVFTDPECPYCQKLHPELKKLVKEHPNYSFLVKLFPLKIHPHSYSKAQSIVCAKSMEMLEQSFAGKSLPEPTCETEVVDQTIALVKAFGIHSTPTLVLPDGTVAPGFRKVDQLQELLKLK